MKWLAGVLRTLTVLVLAIIALELGMILAELQTIQHEQVKNAFYSIPDARRSQLPADKVAALQRAYASTVKVQGPIDVEGTVQVESGIAPLRVEIER